MPQDLVTQELQAELFECKQELEIYKRNEKQMEYLTRENKQLQNEKLCLRETLQRTVDRISFLEEERDTLRSHYYGTQLVEKAAEEDIRKLHGNIDDLRKEILGLKNTIEELNISKKTIEQNLVELRQSASLNEESAQSKRKALEEQITALKKVNNKLEQALLRNNDQNIISNLNPTSTGENGSDSTINSPQPPPATTTHP